MEQGFISLHRKLLTWEWFTDVNVCHLFIYCLLRANHTDTKWRGFEIKRGEFISSLNHISIDTGLSVQQVRTALDKLKKSDVVTKKQQGSNTLISIKNYTQYQDSNKRNNKEITNEQQTNNKEITTNNNDNNEIMINNDNKLISNFDKFNNPYIDAIKKEYKKVFGRAGMLTAENLNKISELAENNPDFMETIPDAIQKLKRVDFSEIGYNAKTLCWLFEKDHYEKVYSGTWDFETREEIFERKRKEEIERRKQYEIANSNRPCQ